MSSSVDIFHKLPNNHQQYTNPHGVHGLVWHYHLRYEPKSVQGKCAIGRIRCVCNAFTDQLDFSQNTTLCDDKQPRYQIPQHCTKSNILGELNWCNIIKLINKDTDKKYFENVHNILLDSICDTMNIFIWSK